MYLSKYSYFSVLQYFLALIFKHWLFFHFPILSPIFFFQVSSSLSEKTDGRYYKYRMQRDSVQQRRDDTRYRIKSLKVMFFIQFWKLGSLTISKSTQLISSCVGVCVRVLGKGKIPLDFTVITACRLSIEMNTTEEILSQENPGHLVGQRYYKWLPSFMCKTRCPRDRSPLEVQYPVLLKLRPWYF